MASQRFSHPRLTEMASHRFSETPLPQRVALALVVGLIVWILYRRNKRRLRYPPGPRPWPVVGNLYQLGNLPHKTLRGLANKYGPMLYLRLGSVPALVVSSPGMAKELFKTHDLVFANRPLSAAGKYMAYGHKDVAFGPYGEEWRHMKKLCTFELLTAKRVESFKGIRVEEVSAMVRSIRDEGGEGTRAVDVGKWLRLFTRNNICKVVAGRVYTDDEFGAGSGFKQMLEEIFNLAGAFCIGDFIPYLDWLDLQGYHRRMRSSAKKLDDFAEKVVGEHVRRRSASTAEKPKQVKDLVDVMLDMAEAEKPNAEWKITSVTIKAIVIDMLFAGIETSSTVVEWAMSELVKNPHMLARAQEELDSVVGRHRRVEESDLKSCEYLRCVIKETFRFHPPVPLLLPHESMEDCVVGEYFIPRKTRVFVNVWAIGRDESVWDDANSFQPERFMGKETDMKGQDFELIPFGSGRRSCPGMLTGLAVVELALAQLVHCFRWSVEGELDMEESFGLTHPRQTPLLARLAWRLNASV